MESDQHRYEVALPQPSEPDPRHPLGSGHDDWDKIEYPTVEFACPRCGAPTQRYIAKNHPYEYEEPFYGCSTYPDCKSVTLVDGTTIDPRNAEVQAENYSKLEEADAAGLRRIPTPPKQTDEDILF